MDITRTPIQWAIRPLIKYAEFTGRATWREYWWFCFFFGVVGYTFTSWLDGALLESASTGGDSDIPPVLTTLHTVAMITPALAVLTRRLNDAGFRGLRSATIYGTLTLITATASMLPLLAPPDIEENAILFTMNITSLVFMAYTILLITRTLRKTQPSLGKH